MKKIVFLSFLFLKIYHVDAQNNNVNIQEQIEQLTSIVDSAQYGIAFKDLQTGNTFFLNEHTVFHAASTMKVPVMVEALRQIRKKKFSLKDSIVVHDHFKSIVDGSDYALSAGDDSDTAIYKNIGRPMSIYQIIFQMITVSSNLATNMMIEKIGAENVMHTMKKLGAKEMKVLRGVEDDKAFAKGLNNTTTAYDLMRVMEAIAKGKAVNKKSSRQMNDILLQQHFKEEIPHLLPANVKVAHKTGWITGIRHDAAIVYLPDGRQYVLVLLSRFPAGKDQQNLDATQKMSKVFYDAVTQ
ncbi:MAG: serine hydrolase [Chitinophagaceae bacterium]